jgi:hypothetical protein
MQVFDVVLRVADSRLGIPGKSMESHSKVSLEVNKTQALMKLSTKREVPDGVTSKLKYILVNGLS